MILGASEIYKRITEEGMITGIDDYEFVIEGATVDVRLDKVVRHDGGAEFYDDRRNVGLLVDIHPNDKDVYEFGPGQAYLVSTMESFNMPVDVIGHIDTRTTMFRSGMILKATYLNPGYSGILTFMLINHSGSTIPVQRGVRIAQIAFHEIKGSCEPYKGLWNNGKIHTNGDFAPPR